jgi:hypothetical protein
MASSVPLHLSDEIIALLQQRAQDYLPWRQIVAGLPASVRRQLGVTSRSAPAEVLAALTPLLDERLHIYQGPTTTCIGYKRSAVELILAKLQGEDGLSPQQLGQHLPLTRPVYIAALNELLQAGRLYCTFQDNYTPMLHVVSHPPAPTAALASATDDRLAFYTAYQTIGQGRNFVRIHRLREALPWPRARFDEALQSMLSDYTIELHGGDPSVLTAEELRHSFTDADGTFYIALSWRGHT